MAKSKSTQNAVNGLSVAVRPSELGHEIWRSTSPSHGLTLR